MKFTLTRQHSEDGAQDVFTFEGAFTEREMEAAALRSPAARARFDIAKTTSEQLLALAEVFRQEPRQTGITTCQMIEAPIGAVFVWCNEKTYYPVALARRLGRGDLIIRPAYWLDHDCHMYRGHVVVDHATVMSADRLEALRTARRP